MSNPGDNQLPQIIELPGDVAARATGYFVPGTEACFFFTFVDLSGAYYDPYNMEVVIIDSNGTTLVESTALDKVEPGRWAYIFTIPSTATPGKYILTLTYISETIDGPVTDTYVENFVIVESGTGARRNSLTVRQIGSRAFLEAELGYIQKIPIWHETIRFNRAKTVGKLSFKRWNQSAGAEIYLNGELIETGYSIDWEVGQVTFTRSLAPFDELWCSYNFRWFTDEELDLFIEQGVNIVNIFPPQSVYTINDIPDRWVIVALYGGIVNALRRWLVDVQFGEPQKLFSTLQQAKDVFGNMETLKKNYEDMMFKLLENKKFGPYVGLTKTITVPEFTLPGGRSRWFRYLFSTN